MSTNFYRFSFPLLWAISCSFVLGGYIQKAQGQTWYDSQGRALTVKGKSVRLQTEQEKKKTLPVLKEDIPSIVKEKNEVYFDKVSRAGVYNQSRSSRRFFQNDFGFRFRSFNNGVFTRSFRNRLFNKSRYNFKTLRSRPFNNRFYLNRRRY